MNVKSGSDWYNLKSGSTVSFSDEQSLLDSKERGLGLKPLNLTVRRIFELMEANNLARWVFVDLDDVQPLRLMIKSVDDYISFTLFYRSDDFAPTTRRQAIDRGDRWLFQPPDDETNYDASRLKYTRDIKQTVREKELLYTQKPQGELHGLFYQKSYAEEQFATIVEYLTEANTENAELLILEIGDTRNVGGEITLYFGTQINPSEIAVLSL